MKCLNKHTFLFLVYALAMAGCSGGTNDVPEEDGESEIESDVVTPGFTVQPQAALLQIVEGEGVVDIPVSIVRSGGHQRDINLTTATRSETDAANLTSRYSDNLISSDEENTVLQLNLSISSSPILPQERTVVISATDTDGNNSTADIILDVQPTSAPDIYLLIGQSNMVGSSEFNAKQSDVGGVDAINPRINQLSVTFNDRTNFTSAEDFTNRERLYDINRPQTPALDPLHSGLENGNLKSGTQIGLGLSFARAALVNTTARIFLVPAAWSDTGFCARETNILPGNGWNATEPTNSAFSGTLLHDRAIARTNAAIEETGGVLRGILWHQGEADSDDPVCAAAYEDNLIAMVRSLRQNIDQDARGETARQGDSDIPFIVATLSMGEDQLPFSDSKSTVDAALRNLPDLLDFTGSVNADDLVPPTYPCGNGSCIHFGSAALRELGDRYYQQLNSVLQQP